jgi:hypothetical protein
MIERKGPDFGWAARVWDCRTLGQKRASDGKVKLSDSCYLNYIGGVTGSFGFAEWLWTGTGANFM